MSEKKSDNSTARPNKYRKISQQIQEAIVSGKYRRGERIPSEVQLTRMHGASRLTVGRALKELEELGLIERRAGSGSYVRQSLHTKGRTFGLLIPELGETEIFETICQGMARASRSNHDELLWGAATRSVESHDQQALELCQHYIAKKVSGVFFAPLEFTPDRHATNARIAEDLRKAGVPLVLLDRDIFEYPARSGFDLVGIDNRRAGHTITAHLIERGCKRILFVGRQNAAPTVSQRLEGYKQAIQKAGLPDLQGTVPADGNDVVAELVRKHRPDGMVCGNDRTAAQAMVVLNELGVEIPQQVKVAGVDDVKYAAYLRVPLTTLRQPCKDLGATAVWTMMQRIEHPDLPARDVLLDCRLLVRQSSGG